MGFLNMALIIEVSALGGGDEKNLCTVCSHAVNEDLEVVAEVIPGSVAHAVFLLVVVSEFDEDVVLRT